MEEVVEVVKRLSVDPESQFFLKNVEDVNKVHVQTALRKSPYALDREVYKLVTTFGGRIVETVADRAFRNTLPRVRLSTKLADTQFSVADKGQRFQADLADITYLRPTAHEAKYVLVVVDVYSQRVYLYGLYKKDKTIDAFKQFVSDTEKVRDKGVQVYVQTDEGTEFFNRPLLRLFEDNGIRLFTTKMNRGHAFMAEQKIRELKKKMTKLKSLTPKLSIAKTLKLVETNMNITRIGYMDLSPTEIEKEIVDPDQNALRKLYVGKRITDQRSRHNRYNLKKDKRRKVKPLEVGDLVYILYGRTLKRRYRGALDKATTGIKPNFDTSKVFVIDSRKDFVDDAYYYKLVDTDTNDRLPGRFYRDELYKL